MKSSRSTSRKADNLRELSERELKEIMKAVGDQARAQSVALHGKVRDNLRKEMAEVRSRALKAIHGK